MAGAEVEMEAVSIWFSPSRLLKSASSPSGARRGPLLTSLATGDASSKMVEAYRLHPNAIKALARRGPGYGRVTKDGVFVLGQARAATARREIGAPRPRPTPAG